MKNGIIVVLLIIAALIAVMSFNKGCRPATVYEMENMGKELQKGIDNNGNKIDRNFEEMLRIEMDNIKQLDSIQGTVEETNVAVKIIGKEVIDAK